MDPWAIHPYSLPEPTDTDTLRVIAGNAPPKFRSGRPYTPLAALVALSTKRAHQRQTHLHKRGGR